METLRKLAEARGNQTVICAGLHHPLPVRVQSRAGAAVTHSSALRNWAGEIPSICFLHYHPEDTGAKSQGIKIAFDMDFQTNKAWIFDSALESPAILH